MHVLCRPILDSYTLDKGVDRERVLQVIISFQSYVICEPTVQYITNSCEVAVVVLCNIQALTATPGAVCYTFWKCAIKNFLIWNITVLPPEMLITVICLNKG